MKGSKADYYSEYCMYELGPVGNDSACHLDRLEREMKTHVQSPTLMLFSSL